METLAAIIVLKASVYINRLLHWSSAGMSMQFSSADSRSGAELGYGFPRDRSEQISFPPKNICIYCGANQSKIVSLTNEHIVADGLGGDLVLPKASCRACQSIISVFEQRAIKSWFGGMREVLAIRSKKGIRKKIRSENNVKWFNIQRELSQKNDSADISYAPSANPLSDFATLAGSFLDHLTYPGALVGETQSSDSIQNFFTLLEHTHSQEFFISSMVDVTDYIRLLAKIGLAYAAACFDGSFVSDLDDIILRNDLRNTGLLIGRGEKFPKNEALHQVSLRRVSVNQRTLIGPMRRDLLVTRIQLFSFADTPTHDVVAGFVSE